MSYFTVLEGDIFQSEAQALVNPVNCVGVMGKGLALKFKDRFPSMFAAYKVACAQGNLRIGTTLVYDFSSDPFYIPTCNFRYVISLPTKNHWRDRSEMQFIMHGLEALRLDIERLELQSVALPALGCGLGGLDWDRVSAVIQDWAECSVPHIHVSLYKP